MISEISEDDVKFNIFLGFDGFIDKIQRPIRTKTDTVKMPFRTMKEFSDYLGEKSGRSCSVDMETLQEKIGGNMPITANALGNLGCQAVCIGAMGDPEVDPIFRNMSGNCELITVSNPGYCNSLEFDDGKLMLASNTFVDQLDYQKLITHAGEESLVEYFNHCDGAAFLNWGELIHSNEIWENILRFIIPHCTFEKKKVLLVDFSDFSKRKSAEVQKMAGLLKEYGRYFDITVSLNQNELELLIDKLDIGRENQVLEQQMILLSKQLACQNFVVHLLDSTQYILAGEVYTIEKEVVENPEIITGGGDNFNAGLLFGLLLDLGIEAAVKLGAGLSCLFVRDGEDVSLKKLKRYMLTEK